MLVKQEIPNGDFCGTYSRESGRDQMCVFIDKGCSGSDFSDTGWHCRRNLEITLGTESDIVKGSEKIVKCRACMKEKRES
jgi:hypothetical protein